MTESGQKVLRHLCQEGYVFRSALVPGSEQLSTQNEGSRRLVLTILKLVYANEKYPVQLGTSDLDGGSTSSGG